MTVLRSGSASDVGRVRTVNQDRVLETPNLFAVADGMGGHAGGEVASRMAMEALQTAFARSPSIEGLQQAIVAANAVVFEHSLDDSELRGMGTTLTAAALVGGSDGHDAVALANVGDSRAYVYSGGHITQITADHSVAEEKVRQGEITEAEAAVHPHRHILTRALGVSSEVEVDLWELKLRRGDRLLLCSDGLTNEVSVPEIAHVLGTVRDPVESARRLVTVANEHGGSDNVTALVVDVLVDDGASNGATVVEPLSVEAPTVGVSDAPTAIEVLPEVEAETDGPPSGGLAKAVAPPVSASSSAVLARQRTTTDLGRAKKESRRSRRRRLGIPRRLTLRVIGFLLLVALVLGAAYGIVRWYATNNWYVTLQGNHLVVYQGQPGGLLWFNPKIVYRSKVTTSQIPQQRVADLRGKVQETSLSAAKSYINELKTEETQLQKAANEATTTTTTAPNNSSPSTSTTTTTAAP